MESKQTATNPTDQAAVIQDDLPTEVKRLMEHLTELRTQHRAYCREHKCFNSETPQYKEIQDVVSLIDERLKLGETLDVDFHDIQSLSGFFDVVANESPAKQIVTFGSDADGNYYFNGNKVIVEHSWGWAYRLREKKIITSNERPVDFYFNYLDKGGKYDTSGNPFYPSTTDKICRRYAFPVNHP